MTRLTKRQREDLALFLDLDASMRLWVTTDGDVNIVDNYGEHLETVCYGEAALYELLAKAANYREHTENCDRLNL